MFQTLIEPEQLLEHLDEPRWRIIDCRFDLADPAAGERAFREAAISRAVYAHLERDLSGRATGSNGRHPLPDPDDLVAKLSARGVGAENQVVVYDDANGSIAARLWWLLRWLGHERVAVLNGGLEGWRALGFPLEKPRDGEVTLARFSRRPALLQAVSTDDVFAAVEGSADWRLIDARARARYLGEVEPIDPVAGHIPSARNRPFIENLDARSRFLPAGMLRERFHALAAGRADRVVHYCGSGVTACHNVLAMEVAGLSGSRLYPGSWSEWISDPTRPGSR